MLNNNQVKDLFKGNIHCSQIVLGEMAEELGYDREEAYRMANAFGGGGFLGDTCGCVAGAMIAIGMKYGNDEAGNKDQDMICLKKLAEFQKRFTERHKSLICRDLLGYDFSDPDQAQAAFDSGKVFEVCPGYVTDAIAILKEIFAED